MTYRISEIYTFLDFYVELSGRYEYLVDVIRMWGEYEKDTWSLLFYLS